MGKIDPKVLTVESVLKLLAQERTFVMKDIDSSYMLGMLHGLNRASKRIKEMQPYRMPFGLLIRQSLERKKGFTPGRNIL